MATPPVPQDFLEHCVKYEYFKRNTAMQAHLNVCELVDRWHSEGPYEGIPEVNNSGKNVKKPRKGQTKATPPKKAKKGNPVLPPWEGGPPFTGDYFELFTFTVTARIEEERNPNSSNPDRIRRVLLDQEASDRDSDDPDMFIEMPDNSNQREQCTLMKTRELYEKIADEELSELESTKIASFAQLMCMQRIAKTRYMHILQCMQSPVCLRIVNGYRKLRIFVERKPLNNDFTITYMSSKDGCLIWYGDDLKVDNTIKYQSLAARDFFYLVKDKEPLLFGKLEFDIEPYRKCDPAIWPFGSFHFKISKYLATIQLKVEIVTLVVINNRGSTENGKVILRNIVNCLERGWLMVLRISVWDDSEVIAKRCDIIPIEGELLDVLYGTRQWEEMKNVEFDGPQIKILNRNSYKHFTHFVNVRGIGQNDLEPLQAAYENIQKEITRKRFSTFHVNGEFDFGLAFLFFVGRLPTTVSELETVKEFVLKNNVLVKLVAKNRFIVFVW